MSDIVLSQNQELAVNTVGKNILVSAAAGSGKTFVLVQRIMKLITEHNVDIDSLLIVTFTKAAAGEMRERIGKAINKALLKEPNNKNLQRQALLLNKATISTIDAFCGSIIKNNFYRTEIDPGYRIISSEDEIRNLMLEAIDKLYNIKYKNNDNAFIALSDAYCNEYKDDRLTNLIISIYNEAQNNPYPLKWLEMCRDNFDIDKFKDFYNTPFGEELKNQIYDYCKKAEDILNKMSEFKEYASIDDSISDIQLICYTLNTNDIANITEDMLNTKSAPLPDYIDKGLCKLYYEAKEYCRRIKALFCDKNNMESLLKAQQPYVNTLVDLVIEFSQIYKSIKLERRYAEFNDILHYTLEILRNPDGSPTEAANDLRKKYREIIIDEYQDSNSIQEEIFTSFSRGNNMFMVGDIKQSIYKFRQANPELFKYKYNTFPYENSSQLIRLSDNYRSKSCVLDFCNHIFSQLMTNDFGEVDYTDEVALKSTDKNPEIYYNTEVHILESFKDLPEDLMGLTKIEYEADYIAETVKNILEENKSVKPENIAILSRTKKNVFYVLLNAFAKRGIPASAENSGSFNITLEIQTVMALLKIIDNPYDNIPIITILHSPIYNFTNEELAKIRLQGSSSVMYISCEEYANGNNNETANKLNKFISDLNKFRQFARFNSLSRLLSYLYDETGYYTYINILPNGGQRQANLTKLTEEAERFEEYNCGSLNEFINYIEKSESINEASVSDKGISGVKLVTMHSSKGLEYPIVILGFTGSNLKKAKRYPIIHQKYGFALKYVKDSHIEQDTPLGDLFKTLLNYEELSEALRLLYVALTRAKERLIITGVSPIKAYEDYKNMVIENPIYSSMNNTNYLSWILFCLRHKKFKGVTEIYAPWTGSLTGAKSYEATSEDILAKLNNIDKDKVYSDKNDSIKNELDYVYHNIKAQKLPTKISISEIKRIYSDASDSESDNMFREISFDYPRFIEDKSNDFSGAKRGTIYHCVFENIDFKAEYNTKEDISAAIDNIVKKGILKPNEADVIEIDKIYAFTQSDLYGRIQKSEYVFKETPFIMSMQGYEIYGDEYRGADNDIIVRGIIDLYFIEDNNIILVDYKTDKVNNHNLSVLQDKYQIQLRLYKRALENNTGLNVKECIIYSVYEDKELVLSI